MTILQLNPTIPVFVVSRDEFGHAIALIDYSQEHHLMWVVALDESGEIWTCPNYDVRLQTNYSMNRTLVTDDNHERTRETDSPQT